LHKISEDIIRIVDDKKLEVKSVFSGLTGCDLQSKFDEINVELHFRPKKPKQSKAKKNPAKVVEPPTFNYVEIYDKVVEYLN